MVKAWVTERTREVAKIGREMFGGNGIISDYYVIKAVADAEVVYTYEGTYVILYFLKLWINSLIFFNFFFKKIFKFILLGYQQFSSCKGINRNSFL